MEPFLFYSGAPKTYNHNKQELSSQYRVFTGTAFKMHLFLSADRLGAVVPFEVKGESGFCSYLWSFLLLRAMPDKWRMLAQLKEHYLIRKTLSLTANALRAAKSANIMQMGTISWMHTTKPHENVSIACGLPLIGQQLWLRPGNSWDWYSKSCIWPRTSRT